MTTFFFLSCRVVSQIDWNRFGFILFSLFREIHSQERGEQLRKTEGGGECLEEKVTKYQVYKDTNKISPKKGFPAAVNL